jgi:hypothetical protein
MQGQLSMEGYSLLRGPRFDSTGPQMPAGLRRVVVVALNLAITVAVLSVVGPYNAWPFELRGEEGPPVLAVGTGRNPRLVTGPLADGAAVIATRWAEGLAAIGALQEVPEAYATAILTQELQDDMAELASGIRDGLEQPPSLPEELGASLIQIAQRIGEQVIGFVIEFERLLNG